MSDQLVEVFIVKDGDEELGFEIRTAHAIAFVDYRQDEFKGVRIGPFPGDYRKEEAVLVS